MKIIILTILSFSFASSIVHAKCTSNENQIQNLINLGNFNLEVGKKDTAKNQFAMATSEIAKLESRDCENYRFSGNLERLKLQVATAGEKNQNTRFQRKVKPANSQ